MQKSLVVIDDLVADPDQLREAALRLTYPEHKAAFPGRNSFERIRLDGLDDIVSQAVGERLQPIVDGLSHGKFRISMAGDQGEGDIHIDMQAHWSGVYYLTPDQYCEGGTDFFRHKATGTDQAPTTADGVKQLGFDSYNAMVEQLVLKDGLDRSKWEHVMRVPMRYNRLILFRPWMWHTAGPGFGTTMENARLVYLLFYRSV